MEGKMFKEAIFLLSGPICSCDDEHITIVIDPDENGKPCLKFQCSECKCSLIVPNSSFVVCIQLDTPYPGFAKKTQETKQDKLTVMDGEKNGGKLIRLEKDESEKKKEE